jgi:hypothetical protein
MEDFVSEIFEKFDGDFLASSPLIQSRPGHRARDISICETISPTGLKETR